MTEEYIPARSRRSQHESGQAALLMTLTMGVTLGVMGLVVDEGWAYWRQEACLTAAQAAAIAGAQYANSNNSTWPPSTCTSTSSISCNTTGATCPPNLTLATNATSVLTAACLYAQENGFKATGNQNVTVYTNTGSPPNVSGVTSAYYVNARVAEKTPLTFLAALVGYTNTLVSASSTATVASTAASDCVWVLDPSSSKALYSTNGVSVKSECGYWVRSSSSTGTWVEGGSSLQAISSSTVNINTNGGYTTPNGGSISPTPVKATIPNDPFLSRPVPLQRSVTGGHTYNCSYGSTGGCAHTSTATYTCEHTNYSFTTGGADVSLTPGVYCGDATHPAISIGNIHNVTFTSGVYILDGGGMNLGGPGGINLATATAGVCFFNTGTNATYQQIVIGNGVPFTALANSSGSQAGIVFYQDPSLTPPINSNTTSQFQGGSNLSIAGSIYLPTTAMLFANGTNTSNLSTAVVVWQVTFNQGAAYFKKDTTNITSLGGTNQAFLVQ
jgi:hypothetical protein